MNSQFLTLGDTKNDPKAIAQISATIMRAARKKKGLTQQEVASAVGVSQSALSKMENGILVPDMFQWYDFCNLTQIDELACKYGFIDDLGRLSIKHEVREGGFVLPGKYAHHRGEGVRNVLPMLDFIRHKVGEEKYHEYLNHLDLDADFFVNYNAQLNFNFYLDLVGDLSSKFEVTPHNLDQVTTSAATARVHGRLSTQYEKVKSSDKVILTMLKNMDKYQIDYRYEVKDQKEGLIDLAVTPQHHLKQFPVKNDTGTLLCEYRKSLLKNTSRYDGLPGLSITELECQHQGATQCLYRMAS